MFRYRRHFLGVNFAVDELLKHIEFHFESCVLISSNVVKLTEAVKSS